MTDITISGKVAEQLQQLAQNENRTVEEFLEDVLESYTHSGQDSEMGAPGTMKRMAWVAEHYPIVGTQTDVSERSREILRDEYADYLLKRIDREA